MWNLEINLAKINKIYSFLHKLGFVDKNIHGSIAKDLTFRHGAVSLNWLLAIKRSGFWKITVLRWLKCLKIFVFQWKLILLNDNP